MHGIKHSPNSMVDVYMCVLFIFILLCFVILILLYIFVIDIPELRGMLCSIVG
jgi:hypothetical protein